MVAMTSQTAAVTVMFSTSPVVMLTLAVNDTATATLAALGVCIALLHRARTGTGQQGSVSLAGTSALLQCEELIRVAGRPAPITGGADFRGPGPADRFYRTRDGWIRIQATTLAGQQALLGLADLGDWPAAADDAAVVAALVGYFAGQQAADVCERLNAVGVPAVRARPASELPHDPQFQRWTIHQRISSGLGGELYVSGRMARFSRTQREDALVPPGVGEHSEQILQEIGLPPAEIKRVISEGVVRAGGPMTIPAVAPYR